MEKPNFDARVLALEEQLLCWRRFLHENAELSFEETLTTDYLEHELLRLGVNEIGKPTKTGLVAHIRGEKVGKVSVLGVRADIDALPITEENDLPFRSKNAGVMHACGHDGHASILLALAALLQGAKNEFCGEIRLFFQHAEELPPGGAIEMARAGAADGVDAMLGLHLSSNFDTGVFGVKAGVLTAAVDRFTIKVLGKGGHCAFPEQCADPVPAAAEIITCLQSIVSRRLAASEQAVVSICEVHGGTAYNVIPNDVTLSVSVRSFGKETRQRIETIAREICEGVCRAHGCTCAFAWEAGYPSVENDERLTALAETQICNRFGTERCLSIGSIMPGEDYSYFLENRPGFFVELGTRNLEKGCAFPHHNPRYRMDEDALLYGLQYEFDMARALLDGTGAFL